jgi:hypothetical protein
MKFKACFVISLMMKRTLRYSQVLSFHDFPHSCHENRNEIYLPDSDAFKYLSRAMNNFIIFFTFFPDKSSLSVSHLVENEIPLSSVIVPSPKSTKMDRLKLSQNSVNDLPIDLNEIVSENAAEMRNGHYTISDAMMIDGLSSVMSPMTDITQNVYSNIPPSSPSVPNILKNAATDHVYSNIDETITSVGSGYMSDNLDLDLDDPLLTSSFVNKKKEKPNNQIIYNTSVSSEIHNINKAIPSISSSSSTTGTQITSIELKNVLNVVLQKSSQSVDASPAIVPPTSLRQTMIDTALDLDSLDGSSIGNNSQVGLMSSKTAIV